MLEVPPLLVQDGTTVDRCKDGEGCIGFLKAVLDKVRIRWV